MALVEKENLPTFSKVFRLAIIFVLSLGTSAIAAPSQNYFIDVVSITWPMAGQSSISVKDVESSIRNVVAPNWREFTTTQGASHDATINFIPGIISVDPIALTRPMACEGTSSLTLMSSVQREFYRSQQITNYNDRYLLILTPEAGCIWQGKAVLGESTSKGGVITLHNTASGFVITHELGHTFGLGHTNLMSCSNNVNDGIWGKACRAIEYGGAIDVMANVETTSPLSTYHQWRMGLISANFIHQSWVNEEISLSASDTYGSTRAIFVRDGNATYWIEYRRGFGQYRSGLAIYRTDPPPISAVESLNPTDKYEYDVSTAIASDVWMLNWDDYTYSLRPTAARGSMTLPVGKTATVFSGNISISARSTSDPAVVVVKVNRKSDQLPPPTPAFSNPDTWRSGDTDIVIKGREDGETKISHFDLKINDSISKAPQSAPKDWLPTYLDPFSPSPTILVKDLPEGTYRLSIRSTDVWGNTSKWSPSQKVTIDRTSPKITDEIQIQSIQSDGINLKWSGALDKESGLCETTLANIDGWITQRSGARNSPALSFPFMQGVKLGASVFDCRGNGVKGLVTVDTKLFTLADASSRSGKWSILDNRSFRCTGRCALSFFTSDKVIVKMGSGSANISISSKPISKVSPVSLAVINNGNQRKEVRIQGSDFTISAIASLRFLATNFVTAQPESKAVDASLQNSEQVELSKFGFRSNDFTDEWTVLPMTRGTTLLDPTLDLCGATFNSESDRIQRRQVIVTKPDSQFQLLSSEVVKYANATAASNALAELKVAFQNCIQNKGGTSQSGIFTPYTFTSIPSNVSNSGSEGNRVIVRATLGTEGATRQLLAIYQYKGALFSGLYVIKPSSTALTDEEVLRWIEVARTFASRM